MSRIFHIIIFTLFTVILSSCRKFEVITQEESKVTVNKGYHLNGKTNKTIFGKRTEIDTLTGHIISVTKYRSKGGCFGQNKSISRTRVYKDGKRTLGWKRQKHIYEL